MATNIRAELDRRQKNAALMIAYFREHRGEWIDIPTLERVGGRNAWRTRVSEARSVFCDELGWTWPILKGGRDPILNRQTRAGDVITSTYRYWPFEIVGRSEVPYLTSWPVAGSPMADAETWRLT